MEDLFRGSLIVPEQGTNSLKNFDGKAIGIVPSLNASALQYAQPNWDGYRIHQWIKLWRSYRLIPPAMKQPSPVSMGQILSSSGDNLSAWLMWLQAHSVQSFIRVNEVLHDLFPDVLQVRTIPTPDGKVHLAPMERGLKRPTKERA